MSKLLGWTPPLMLLGLAACSETSPADGPEPFGAAPGDVQMDDENVTATPDAGTEGAVGDYWACRYTNPFSMAEECRGYLGDAWEMAAIEENCGRPYTGVVGELSMQPCPTDGAIGTCTEDPGGDNLLVTWIYGGDPEITGGACEGFAGGVWSTEGGVPGTGGGIEANGEPMEQAINAMNSNTMVNVTPGDCADGACLDGLIEQSGAIVFEPVGGTVDTGFILYPGAAVDPRSYAPAAQAIAREGYLVAIVPMPSMLAFNGVSRADDVIAAHPSIQHWFLGGHSMGGVTSVRYAFENSADLPIDGLILWATFPNEADDISGSGLPVASIYGDQDLLSTVEEIEVTKGTLPADTRFVLVPGGNHAQFGYYGLQDGDGDALIDREAQHLMITASTVHFMRSVAAGEPAIHPGFAAAEALEANWCQRAQRIVANVSDAQLPDASIANQTLQESRAYGESKAAVDGSATPPVEVRTRLIHAGNGDVLNAPPIHSAEVWCKLKNQEALLAEMTLSVAGAPQDCTAINQAALDWALAQLSTEERAAYDASGRSVTFAPDNAQATGVEWLTTTHFSAVRTGDTLEVTAPSLPVPLDADAGDAFVGVHYCKLWSPVDALRFVL